MQDEICETTFLKMFENQTEALDNKPRVGAMLVDLTKLLTVCYTAYSSLNHVTYGMLTFNHIVHKNRGQRVQIRNPSSTLLPIVLGVTQMRVNLDKFQAIIFGNAGFKRRNIWCPL